MILSNVKKHSCRTPECRSVGVESYITSRIQLAVNRGVILEAETDRSKDETQSDREWLLAALLAIAVEAEDRMARGIDPEQVSAQLKSDWMDALRKAGTSAFRKGAALRATEFPNNPSDVASKSERLRSQLEKQSNFLSNFADDYVSGVTTEPQRMNFINRAHLYALSMVGYYNLGALEGGSPNDRIYWRLGACDHCTDCPALHVSGPYTRSTLPTVPGLGQTRCGHWCCCSLFIVPSALDSILGLSISGAVAMAAAVDAGQSTARSLMDTRLRSAYASRMAIDTEDEAFAQTSAELQSELDTLIASSDFSFDDKFPLGGPIIGMSDNDIDVPDLLYNEGIDAASLRSIKESDIEDFLNEQLRMGAEGE